MASRRSNSTVHITILALGCMIALSLISEVEAKKKNHWRLWRRWRRRRWRRKRRPVLAVRVLATNVGVTLPFQRTLHAFLPFTNSWVKIKTGDLPEPRVSGTAVQLSPNTMIVIGGFDRQDNSTKTVFTGTIIL